MLRNPAARLTVFALLAALALAALALAARGGHSPASERARDIASRCAGEGDHAPCYEREVPRLYPELSVPELFDIVREIRRRDPTYTFCHVLGHKIGERVVAEDPARWSENIVLNPPDNLCSSGYLHGVAIERFRADVFDDALFEESIPSFAAACTSRPGWQLSDFIQATCYHGLGHLFFYIADADMPKALSVCTRTARGGSERDSFTRLCYEGVFMSLFQPLEPDDFLLIERMEVKPSTTTVRSYCARFLDNAQEGACLRESWPYSREDILGGEGVGAFCSGQPDSAQEFACYESSFSIMGRMALSRPEDARTACDLAPEKYRVMCYERAALAILEEDMARGGEAVALCEAIPGAYQDECMQFLAARAEFVFGDRSKERGAFCAALPEEFARACSAGAP